MTVLVDTGVLYADHDADAARHEAANVALGAVYDGEFGSPYASDYIDDEAVTLTVTRGESQRRGDATGAKAPRRRAVSEGLRTPPSREQSSTTPSISSSSTTISR